MFDHLFFRALLLITGLGLSVSTFSAEKFPCPDRSITLSYFLFGVLYNEKGEGRDKDLVDEFRKRTGCQFETSVKPRARTWKELELGQLDMTTGGVPSPEREEFAYFLPIYHSKNYMLLRKSVPPTVKSLDDFLKSPALRLGVIRGFLYGPPFDDFVEQMVAAKRVEEAPEINNLFLMLQNGRFDGTVALPTYFRPKIRELGLENEIRVMEWGGEGHPVISALVLSKKTFSAADARRWQMIINDMRADGTLFRIVAKYMPLNEAKASMIKAD